LQKAAADGVPESSKSSEGEPLAHIGRLLAEKYSYLIATPIPMSMLALLVQIEYRDMLETEKNAKRNASTSESR